MNTLHKITALILFISFLFVSCQSDNTAFEGGRSASDLALFERLSPEQTGIDFNNQITEDSVYNHILRDVVFNGGGIAVLDVNNDGLQDLYFAGNQVSDRLYLNKGNLKFEDITQSAGIENQTWSTGVTVADVNNDGWDDIYVGKYMLVEPEDRSNSLYINNGDNTFSEQAEKYGVADKGHCTAVNFFDYNKDGHVDLYVGNQPFTERHIKYSGYESDIDKSAYTDRLFRNTGNGSFQDVTQEAGITNYNYTLSVTVSDVNNDSWPDIYVASDYEEPDYYFLNRGDGTFVNALNYGMRHISNFSMGVDIADINQDGWMDIYVADMAAADNYRQKANMSGMNPEKFWNLANSGYHYQYMFNTLQLNNGNGTFSEIAQLSGVANTDWSWATLLADFDNDGDKDLLVTNGLKRDVKNKDYEKRRNALVDSLYQEARARGEKDPRVDAMAIAKTAPSIKLKNYIYEYNGDLTYSDRVEEWGFETPTWSQGAIYADLDNDGDLEIVVHNMDDPAHFYENKAVDEKLNNYLRIELEGDHQANRHSLGGRVWLWDENDKLIETQEISPTRGYMSTCEPILHFGLGTRKEIPRLVVQWLDGRQMELTNVKVNQMLVLKQSESAPNVVKPLELPVPLMQDVTASSSIRFNHQENNFDDYAREVLLPHRMSTLGPCLAKADVNNDGREDFFVGGAAGQAGKLFIQAATGNFTPTGGQPWANDLDSEDIHALFFDADADGDQDLYVSSGGNEFDLGDPKLQDRLYLNDGKGQFSKSNALPRMDISTGVAAAGDMDGDGDADLFVGGRQIPGKYGMPSNSFILRNDGGTFSDVTAEIAPELQKPGMVTDAKWFDYDGDDDQDLLVVGEWMPLTFFQNDNGQFSNATEVAGLGNTSGWWNRIQLEDMDGDGDLDFVAGNLGLNIKFKASEEQPFRCFVKDFDNNGTHDTYLAYYDEDGVSYPVRGRQCSSEQMPFVKKEFKTYHEFALAPVEKVLGERREGATELDAKIFESVYVENKGDGQFEVKVLPNEAQVAPVFGIVTADLNQDGNKDILVAGNYYEREVETVRSDAGIGQVLLGDGKGNFSAMHPLDSGLFAGGDVRNAVRIDRGDQKPLILIANNKNSLQVFELSGTEG